MRIDVRDIRKARGLSLKRSLDAEVEPFDYRGETVSFRGPVHLDVHIHNAGGNLWADVAARGRVVSACARCLEPVERDLEFSYSEVFRRSDQEPLEDDLVRETVYEGDEIDLGEGFLEQLLLALPMRELCRSDCKGLCPRCGANLNQGDCGCDRTVVDPRLARLAELLRQGEDQ